MGIQWFGKERAEAAAAWMELKYGMLVHYGLYSMLGGVWKGRPVAKGYSEQILFHGNIPHAEYEALAASFTAERFDAPSIASLAKAAGMRYVVMVAKHHDGFCLFDTRTSLYRSTASPCRRDLVGEMAAACQGAGLGFGVYFSWIDWRHPCASPASSHNCDPITPGHMELNLAQLEELLGGYGPVCELWMDMGAPTAEQSRQVFELARRLQPQLMINGRIWNGYGDFATMADNETPDRPLAEPWETPASIHHGTWGYRSWQKMDGLQERIAAISGGLSKVLDQGGNYLLSIGPMGDGSVVPFERDVLLGVAARIRERGGLRRRPAPPCRPVAVPAEGQVLLRAGGGRTLFRQTGADYRSARLVPAAIVWDIVVEEEGDYLLRCAAARPPEREERLRVETEGGGFAFALGKGRKDATVRSAARLRGGRQEIALGARWADPAREALPAMDIGLMLQKV